MEAPFKPGDIVRLPSAEIPMTVLACEMQMRAASSPTVKDRIVLSNGWDARCAWFVGGVLTEHTFPAEAMKLWKQS